MKIEDEGEDGWRENEDWIDDGSGRQSAALGHRIQLFRSSTLPDLLPNQLLLVVDAVTVALALQSSNLERSMMLTIATILLYLGSLPLIATCINCLNTSLFFPSTKADRLPMHLGIPPENLLCERFRM
ncbi:hypothetical protein LWI28_002578 [Acer negundo]|uniref:Uncharacterized protein n=1 Tax=Acer negundo TaxID=4023 RepID=A0AAD5ISC9_ACENE|nr:hypothetical protein LWI28_002578 [Acer negundo]